MSNELNIQVPKGVKVNIEEVEDLLDDDPRVPNDRNIIISTNKNLKLAIKKSDGDDPDSKSSVVLMCG
ncbi:TPA: hypothetical protein ACV5EY_003930 [Klebsiella aerogenes]|uniref:hypothetical protein n=1 Tax=Klebsiella sp. 141161 TaxID=3020037 RepID=UPI0013B01A65|nr:hypothetical protein [Klebsiella aerogenes]